MGCNVKLLFWRQIQPFCRCTFLSEQGCWFQNTPEQKVKTCFALYFLSVLQDVNAVGSFRCRRCLSSTSAGETLSVDTTLPVSQGRFLINLMEHGVKDEVRDSLESVVLSPAEDLMVRTCLQILSLMSHAEVAVDFRLDRGDAADHKHLTASYIQLEINISAWSCLCFELIFRCCNMRVKDQLWLLTTSLCETTKRGSDTHNRMWRASTNSELLVCGRASLH